MAAEPMAPALREAVREPRLDAAVRGIGLRPYFQPIVDLADFRHAGYEALARWPASHVTPAEAFEYALETGQADRLDGLCIAAALETGLDGLPPGTMLALNCEPASSYVGRAHNSVVDRAGAALSLVFELTERCLLSHPRALLAKVEAIRSDGFSVALDDVGAHVDSLTMLDVLAPEIIKLDLGLIQSQPGREQSRTLAAVLAYRERTGAAIVAEGIESDMHLERAVALGATLGQGFKFGRPEPLQPWAPKLWAPPKLSDDFRHANGSALSSPFDLVGGRIPVRVARKEILTALSRHVERQAGEITDPPMILTALQDKRQFTPDMQLRYQRLAQTAPLVALFGRGLLDEPAPRLRGIDLAATDPLCAEWTIVALGAQTAVALIAREHRDSLTTSDHDRRFDFALTYDRALVTAAAHNLLARIPALPARRTPAGPETTANPTGPID